MAHGLIGPDVTGAALKALRLRSGLTQAALAGKAGLHVNSIKRLERSAALPWTSASSIERVSKALGVTILPSITHPKPRPIEKSEWFRRQLERYNFASSTRTGARPRHGVLPDPVNPARASLAKLKCGARTRRGTACACKALPSGRCKFHGGLSTGPRTPEGRAKIAEAQRKRWAAWRERQQDLAAGRRLDAAAPTEGV